MPQKSPTVLRPPTSAFSDLSLSQPSSPEDRPPAGFGRRDFPEATDYLSQFHATSAPLQAPHRARNNRNSADNSNLPSLIHSPSSSFGTAASVASTRPQIPSRSNPLYSSFHNATKSIDLVNPFLPTSEQQLPSSASAADSAGSLKSGASVQTAFRVVESEDMSYEKRASGSRNQDGAASLKNLFGEAIRGLPKEPVRLRRASEVGTAEGSSGW
ncbi:hypothetical protein MBLNU230_g8037t1 [Neophaeotheca triangularis]